MTVFDTKSMKGLRVALTRTPVPSSFGVLLPAACSIDGFPPPTPDLSYPPRRELFI